ncbi:MAG: hypothetical protein FWE42_03870 [Defluviitaleaceae bacterium]|nr:hypothetical protein [Defluviitaleaceae bacterium]
MERRKLTVNWGKDAGNLDMRYHSVGIGGVHSMPAPKQIAEHTATLKPGIIRIFLQEFFYIYKGVGQYDWAKMDAYMDAVHATGADIMASICLKPAALFPQVDETIWLPNNIEEWQELIRNLVLRYSKEKQYVTHWAIGNEVNIGEWGGCPYLIKNPDDFFEYYKITAKPILEALPGTKIGGPSFAGGGAEAAAYIGRFVELCKENGVQVDFASYNAYNNCPKEHLEWGRVIRDAINKYDPQIKLYMTEFNVGLVGHDDLSIEEEAFSPWRAASLAAAILEFHEDGCLDGTFQYHLYDQFNDPREFAPWYARTRYMAEHWSDLVHRLGLFDLDGKARPQYFMYKMLYDLEGRRVGLDGAGDALRGIASAGENGTMSIFLSNLAEDAAGLFQFENAEEGIYRLNVYRIDRETTARMKASPMYELPVVESRVVYVHPDFHFHVVLPGDSVTLVQLVK